MWLHRRDNVHQAACPQNSSVTETQYSPFFFFFTIIIIILCIIAPPWLDSCIYCFLTIGDDLATSGFKTLFAGSAKICTVDVL